MRTLLQPKATIEALQAFKHLRTLELTMVLDARLQLGQITTDLLSVNYSRSGSPHFYLKEVEVQEHIVNLYKQLVGNDNHSTLDTVKVRLQTNRQYNEWLFVIQAQSRDGKRFRVEKDFLKAKPGFIYNGMPDLANPNFDAFG